MRQIDKEEILYTMYLKKFKVHQKPYMLNIVGVRSSNQTPMFFDDAIIFFMFDGLKWYWMQCDGTTDPGLYYLQNPMRKEGTIIMCPGQFENLYTSGLHKGEQAFRQYGSAKYVRDNNKDEYLDFALMDNHKEVFFANDVGTNLHDAHETQDLEKIGRYSAGCQVVRKSSEFDIAIKWRDLQIKNTGNKFYNYTLLLESELKMM